LRPKRVSAISDRGWTREFDDPIALPDGSTLVTLLDAGSYIIGLPEKVHTAAEWQAAMEALILVADLGGPTMFAQIGIMKALYRDAVLEFRSDGARRIDLSARGQDIFRIGISIKNGPKALKRRQGNRKKSYNVADLLAKTHFKKRPSFFANARWRSAGHAGL